MSLVFSELLHTLGVTVAAYVLLTLLALFLKAEAATGTRENPEADKP